MIDTILKDGIEGLCPMMYLAKYQKTAKWAGILLMLCCICVHLIVYGVLNFDGFARYCNSDVYADSQIAVKMWEQKTLFPDGWTFGNQFYVAATPVLAALLYGLTGSINTAMALATEIMTLLILISFFWLLRSVTRNLFLQITACLVLLTANVAPYGPYSVNSMLFFTQASFYACYLITLFVVFGDYIRVYSGKNSSRMAWMLSLALSFAMGMQSLRQTVVMVLPILACEIFVTLRRKLLGKRAWSGKTLIRSVSYAGANAAGAVVMELLNPPNVSIYGELETASLADITQRLEPVKTALCEITSLSYVLEGECGKFMALIILGLIALAVMGALLWLIRIHREETALELCWLLLAVGILGVLLSTIVMNITLRGIYLFMWFPLVACSTLMLMKKLPGILNVCVILVLCSASLLGVRDSYGIYLQLLEQNEPTESAQVCQWAMDEGYDYVYGDYWGIAPEIAVYSDGALEAGCWHTPENVFYVELVNTPQNIYGEEENEKAIYVFTSEDEEAGLRAAAEEGIVMEKVAQFGDCKVYTSPVQLMRKWG